MGHPLDGAFLRLARAERHLQEATELLCEWEAATKDKIVRDDNGQYRFDGFADIPVMMLLVVGDVIHNFAPRWITWYMNFRCSIRTV